MKNSGLIISVTYDSNSEAFPYGPSGPVPADGRLRPLPAGFALAADRRPAQGPPPLRRRGGLPDGDDGHRQGRPASAGSGEPDASGAEPGHGRPLGARLHRLPPFRRLRAAARCDADVPRPDDGHGGGVLPEVHGPAASGSPACAPDMSHMSPSRPHTAKARVPGQARPGLRARSSPAGQRRLSLSSLSGPPAARRKSASMPGTPGPRPAPGTAKVTWTGTPTPPAPPPPGFARPSVESPMPEWSGMVVSRTARIPAPPMRRGAVAARWLPGMPSIVTFGLERNLYAAFRSASPGNTAGTGSPCLRSHARAIAAMRVRTRPSGWVDRPNSRSIRPASSASAGAGPPQSGSGGSRRIRPRRQTGGAARRMRDAHPGQDQETGVVDRQAGIRRARPRIPADEGVPRRLVPVRRVERKPADAARDGTPDPVERAGAGMPRPAPGVVGGHHRPEGAAVPLRHRLRGDVAGLRQAAGERRVRPVGQRSRRRRRPRRREPDPAAAGDLRQGDARRGQAGRSRVVAPALARAQARRQPAAARALRRRPPQPIDRIGPEPSHAHPHANHIAWMGYWVDNVSVTAAGHLSSPLNKTLGIM